MNEYESLNHAKWECKYHVVFIPKYRRKALYGSLRKHLGSLFRELARHKECEVGEGHLMVDHVHMLLSSWDCSEAKAALSGSQSTSLPLCRRSLTPVGRHGVPLGPPGRAAQHGSTFRRLPVPKAGAGVPGKPHEVSCPGGPRP